MPFNPQDILQLPVVKINHNVIYTSAPDTDFENAYIRLRKKEGWFYTGTQLQQLPDVSKSDKLYPLWQIRKKSAGRLVKYVQQKQNIQNLLDVGCGNGWLTNKLAQALPGTQILGVDRNATELQLAAGCFPASNITWLYGDVLNNLIQQNTIDIIVLSASVQYFPDIKSLVQSLLYYLKPGGEIHMLDSPFYTQTETKNAAIRSAQYYAEA
ncbi:MAG: class I SAM-dependent methyltransferase, partial [Chitinophagales bacterium]